MSTRDYYEVLEVSREATPEQIKQAYRKLARKYHPDLHPGDKQAESKFKELQEAYDVLGDADKRDQYDRFGRAAFEGGPAGTRSRNYTWSNAQGQPEFDFDFVQDSGAFEDIVGGLFGRRGGGRRTRTASGEDAEVEVSIPFQTAAMGGDLDVSIRGPTTSRLTIKVPPGVNDGARLRLAGKGHPSAAGGPPGDLYVLVRVQPHPYFTRNGNDIYLDVPVTATEAALGATVDVPTLDGKISLQIPPGSSSGQKLRIRGKGCPNKGGGRGDQLVVVRIVVPRTLDAEGKRRFDALASLYPTNPRADLGW